MIKINLRAAVNRELREKLERLNNEFDVYHEDDEARESIVFELESYAFNIARQLEVDNPSFRFAPLALSEGGFYAIAIGHNIVDGVWHQNCWNGTGHGFYTISFYEIDMDDTYNINNPKYDWFYKEFNKQLKLFQI